MGRKPSGGHRSFKKPQERARDRAVDGAVLDAATASKPEPPELSEPLERLADPSQWPKSRDPLAATESAIRKRNNAKFVASLTWPTPACKCADPQVVHRILAVAFGQIRNVKWRDRGFASAEEAVKHYVPADTGGDIGTVVLLPRFKYYKLTRGGVDDEHLPPSVLDSDTELRSMLLDVRIGNWPSLAHVIAELLRSEALMTAAPAFGSAGFQSAERAELVESYESMLEMVQGLLHKGLALDKDIVSYDDSLEVHVCFHKALRAAFTAVALDQWQLLWSSPISRGFHLMLVGYCENLATYAKQCHHLDYDGGQYRPSDACDSHLGWNVSLAVELTPAWFWRLVHAGLVPCPRATDGPDTRKQNITLADFDLDDPAWAKEVAAARRVKLLYECVVFDAHSEEKPVRPGREQPIWTDVCANDMPLLYCMPAPLTDLSRAACSRRFSVEEWCTLQARAKDALLQTPMRAARGGRAIRGLTLMTDLPFDEALAGMQPWSRDAFQMLRRIEKAGQPPTPWKRNCAFRIQRAFRRRRKAPPPAPPAPISKETNRLMNSIVIGVEGIETTPASVGNWWWKRPRRTTLEPISISLEVMPMLELVQAVAETVLKRWRAGWPLTIIASTGAVVLNELLGGVHQQLTKVHSDDATGAVPSANSRSLALWKLVAERRMKAVFYVHFVHPIRRMAWATRQIVLGWRGHVLARAAQSHAYALSIHQHSFMTANLERCAARGVVATRAEMETAFARTAVLHPAVGPTLLGLYTCAKLKPKEGDDVCFAVYSVVYGLLRSRDLSDCIRSTGYIRESLATARKQWARYPDRDDGGNRWRANRWRWNADGKWKPAPEPHVCWRCGKQECKRSAEQRAWDDRWDGGHAVRVALRIGRSGDDDPNGAVLAVLRPVPVLQLGAVEREGEVGVRPFAGAELPEPFTFKMRACPCPRCEKLERGAGARYHDAACQAADWPRHKRGAGPAVSATRS